MAADSVSKFFLFDQEKSQNRGEYPDCTGPMRVCTDVLRLRKSRISLLPSHAPGSLRILHDAAVFVFESPVNWDYLSPQHAL
jgi:hypothetical protein